MNEIWKDIPEYEGLYQVSNLGRVKSLSKKAGCSNRKERIRKLSLLSTGYLYVLLSKNNKHKNAIVHRLVMSAFKDKSDLTVNHIDGNKQNNSLDNLEYCTQKENIHHSWKLGLSKPNLTILALGREMRKKKVKQYDLQGNFIKEYESRKQASIETTISDAGICNCLKYPDNHKTAGGFIWRSF